MRSGRLQHTWSSLIAASMCAIWPTSMQCELAPREQVRADGAVAFRQQRLRIDPRAQALVALLRHGLSRKIAETLEAETLALTLVRRALGERTSHAAGASLG